MVAARQIMASQLMFWVVVAGICTYFLWPLRDTLRLGMDLAGGTYLTLEVQTDKAIAADLIDIAQSLETKLKKAQHALPVSKEVVGNSLVLSYDSASQAQDTALFLKDAAPEFDPAVDGSAVRITLSDRRVQQIKEDAVTRNIGVLRTRLDPYGAAEIAIAQQGERNIIIELPDTAKTLETKARIGKSAQLDFRLVERSAGNKEDILIEYDGELPVDKEILPGKSRGDQAPYYYLVSKYTDITGKYLKDARAGLGGDGGSEAVVNFTFNPDGAQKFYELTSRNIGRVVAIILDGIVISAGQIKSAIRESGSISGGFRDIKETRELALLLQSGSYVAPVTFEEERQIGPSLGYESIRSGLVSCLVGLLLVLIFSIFYYGVAGLFAFVTLLFNLLLILVGMSWLRATLTLPGIAGMVLTIGMAIDASILIYEQIKEELKKGVALKNAVNTGFSGAMEVILDANITTFVTGLVLYHTGSGPIQGFAVTMMLGIVATLITGLFFLKSIFSFVLANFNVQKLGF